MGSFSSRIVVLWRNSDESFPSFTRQQNDREMNNLLVCSHSLPGKIKFMKVKTNDVTIYGISANL